MRAILGRLWRGDAGITITELSISMAITALLSTVMVAWIFAGFGSDSAHSSYDRALEDLRNVADQISREVRAADHLTTAEPATMSFWLDGDRDGIADEGETITWAIESGGTMTRTIDDGSPSAVIATNLSPSDSVFAYDAVAPADVTRVTIGLVALAQTRAGGDELFHSLDVYLRNA